MLRRSRRRVERGIAARKDCREDRLSLLAPVGASIDPDLDLDLDLSGDDDLKCPLLFSRHWFPCIDARLAMLPSVSGCSSPSDFILFSKSCTSRSSTSSNYRSFILAVGWYVWSRYLLKISQNRNARLYIHQTRSVWDSVCLRSIKTLHSFLPAL